MIDIGNRRGTVWGGRVVAAAATIVLALPAVAADGPPGARIPELRLDRVTGFAPIFGADTLEAESRTQAAAIGTAPRLADPTVPRVHRFLERISSVLERGGAPERVEVWRIDPTPNSATTESLGRDVWRATKKSLEHQLLDATTFDEEVESWDERFRPGPAGSAGIPAPEERRSAPEFRVGFSHRLPKLEMRCAAGAGTLRLTLHALGRVGVDYGIGPRSGARVHASFDPRDETFRLGWRASF